MADANDTPGKIFNHVKSKLVASAPDDKQLEASDLTISPDYASYVMGRIANKMQTKTKEIEIDEANVEHVFPQNPEDTEWGGLDNHEKLEPFLWHVGNLTILGKRLNRGVGNKEYSHKRSHYKKASELEITKQLANKYSKWDVESIKDRSKALLIEVLNIWNFDNPSFV